MSARTITNPTNSSSLSSSVIRSELQTLENEIATIGTFSNNVTPTGTVNGVNAIFTLANTPINSSLMLLVNGQVQTSPENYTISGATITFVAGQIPQTGQILKAFYAY